MKKLRQREQQVAPVSPFGAGMDIVPVEDQSPMGGDALPEFGAGMTPMQFVNGDFRPFFGGAPVLDARELDGTNRLRERVRSLFRPLETDTASTASFKLRKQQELLRNVEALGPITAQDADGIVEEYLKMVAGDTPSAFATFSPESQALLQEAFGGEAPMRRIATGADLSEGRQGLLAGLAVASLISGRGLGDVLPAVQAMVMEQQGINDQQYALEVEDDQRRRQAAAQMAQRLISVEDYNNQQRGYQARDERAGVRGLATQALITDRQERAEMARQEREARNILMNHAATIDPARWGMMVDIYEFNFGPLPEGIRDARMTLAQEGTAARNQLTQAQIQTEQARTTRVNLDNEIAKATFDSVVKSAANRADLSQLQLDEMAIKIKNLPEDLEANRRAKIIRAMAAKLSAEAAMVRAKHPPSSGSGNPYNRQLKDEMSIYGRYFDDTYQMYQRALDAEVSAKRRRDELDILRDRNGKLPLEFQRRYESLDEEYKEASAKAQKLEDELDLAVSRTRSTSDRMSGSGR
jgi:hypothetical protein